MFLACLVKYVGECLVCVMYVCRWLYCSEGVFCVLCEFVPVCLPVVVYDRLFCCIVCLLSVCIVSNDGRWSEFSAWIVFQVVLLYSEDDMVVISGDVG